MPPIAEILAQTAALLVGTGLALGTLLSAIRSFVLARSARDPITAIVFGAWQRLFNWRARRARTYPQRDQIMAMYAPISLLSLPIAWLTLTTIGYTFIYGALGITSPLEAFTLSGSALTTLGFSRHDGWLIMAAIFSEAAVGLILIALLIAYLPTMYSAFSTREAAVTRMAVRAGSPPSAIEMISRAHRIHGLDYLAVLWEEWERWFAQLEESHTSLAPLVFFRSPTPNISWVTALGTVLDAASLYASTLDVPRNPQAELCIRAGYLALRSIANFFRIPHDPNPAPTDPVSISREEFDAACDQLEASGVPLKPDRDQAWRDFVGWRVNYDMVLLSIAALTMAPYAPWISDRSHPRMRHVYRGANPVSAREGDV